MEQPDLVLNPWSILVAAVIAFVFGGLWYGPVFGKTWGRLMGMDMSKPPPAAVLRRAMILQSIGLLLTSFVMAHFNQAWRPSVWGAGTDASPLIYGFFGGFFAWIGFYIPMQLGKVSWEGRPWRLFVINTGHDFVTLMLISQITAWWR
ncbi:MAG: DUF1761 domain-containing protein [Bdellovibrionota bacterium]